jgi:putative ABC transport system ATP-binding protein
MNIVTCKNLAKSYGSGEGEVHALRGVDFEVKAGELMMLVGPSGCGKTTLISIVALILTQDKGTLDVCGQSIAKLSARQRAQVRQKNLGFVFQSYNLIPALTVAENVAIPLVVNGMSLSAGCKRALPWLERVGLNGKEKAYPRQLSGGQQQRVAIARSLIHEPSLIVCDEPTSALDHDNGERILQLLRTEALSSQRAIIVVTHDNRIFQHADKIANMDDGQITSFSSKGKYDH